MKIEAKARLVTPVTAAPNSAMLQRFDDLAASDPKAFRVMVDDWVRNFSKGLEADVQRAFSKGNPDKNALKTLKAKLIKLNNVLSI